MLVPHSAQPLPLTHPLPRSNPDGLGLEALELRHQVRNVRTARVDSLLEPEQRVVRGAGEAHTQ